MRGTVGHTARAATRAKAAPLATERNELLVMAGLAPDPQKSMFKTTAFQVILELLYHILRQRFALRRELIPERRPVLLDQLVE